MAFDFKKEYREFYLPKAKPEIVNVPAANFIAVCGVGDPNEEGGVYKALFHWISVIRLPDFVTKSDFGWAVAEATRKKSWTAPQRSF